MILAVAVSESPGFESTVCFSNGQKDWRSSAICVFRSGTIPPVTFALEVEALRGQLSDADSFSFGGCNL
jgi:hypothetical protein